MSSKITLNDAMETLSSMFPDVDKATIKTMLYKTNGHMERTIEHLLTFQSQMGSPNDVVSPQYYSPNSATTPSTTSTPPSSRTTTTTTNATPRTIRHNLSADFLVFSEDDVYSTQTRSNNSSATNQLSDDEQYAREVQRMMIMEQTDRAPRSNQSANAATRRQPQTQKNTRPPSTTGSTNHYSSSSTSSTTGRDMRGFGSTASRPSNQGNLSDFAKKKFADFKSKFTRSSTNTGQNYRTNNNTRRAYNSDSDDEGDL